jgi:HipA-like protein
MRHLHIKSVYIRQLNAGFALSILRYLALQILNHMGRKAEVYVNETLAGILEKVNQQLYVFRYEDSYYNNPKCSAVSLTMPKKQQEYQSKFLFPFFYGLLSEGYNKELQCRLLQIDPNDHFSHLLAIAHTDTIGAVMVRETK